MRENLKNICNRILFPPTAVVLCGIPVTAALMAYVFVLGHEDKPTAYAAYLVCAYAFAILCAWCVRRGKKIAARVRVWLRRIPLADRYLSDAHFRWLTSLHFSTLANVFYAIMKLCMGVYYRSYWFITFAVYYMLLMGMRTLLMRGIKPEQLGANLVMENRRRRACGVILLFLNSTLTGMVILAIHDNQSVHYPGTLIFAAAAYDFYIITMAIINLVKVRKHGSPVLSAARVLSLASAMIAMLCLETAMLSEFGSEDDLYFRNLTIALTGLGISAILIAASVFMIRLSSENLGKQEA